MWVAAAVFTLVVKLMIPLPRNYPLPALVLKVIPSAVIIVLQHPVRLCSSARSGRARFRHGAGAPGSVSTPVSGRSLTSSPGKVRTRGGLRRISRPSRAARELPGTGICVERKRGQGGSMNHVLPAAARFRRLRKTRGFVRLPDLPCLNPSSSSCAYDASCALWFSW